MVICVEAAGVLWLAVEGNKPANICHKLKAVYSDVLI